MVQFDELLGELTKSKASDLHLKVGSIPFVRINGRLEDTSLEALSHEDIDEIARELLPKPRALEYEKHGETDFALSIPSVGRFRVSAIRQRGTMSLVLRRVLIASPSIDALGLPEVLKQLAAKPAGLILISGPGDSGKSTTVSAVIDEINDARPVSILSIENPIEILHADKSGYVIQREVGSDTEDYLEGLSRSLRHDADVLYLDAVPNSAVLEGILAAATARLVIAIVPGLGAADTIQRLINFFPPQLEHQVRRQLASVLQGVLSQRLLPRADRRGRVAAFEVLVNTSRAQATLMGKGDAQDLEVLIKEGDYNGMRTLDQAIVDLFAQDVIDQATAMSMAQNGAQMRIELGAVTAAK